MNRAILLSGFLLLSFPAGLPAQQQAPAPVQRAQQRNLELRLRAGPVLETFALQPGQQVATFGIDESRLLEGIARAIGSEGRLWAVFRRESFYAARKSELVGEFGRRVWAVFAEDRDARLEPGSIDRVILIDQAGFFRDGIGLYRQAASILKPGGRLVVLRDPKRQGDKYAGLVGPPPPEMVPLDGLGFELVDVVRVLQIRQIWVLELGAQPSSATEGGSAGDAPPAASPPRPATPTDPPGPARRRGAGRGRGPLRRAPRRGRR